MPIFPQYVNLFQQNVLSINRDINCFNGHTSLPDMSWIRLDVEKHLQIVIYREVMPEIHFAMYINICFQVVKMLPLLSITLDPVLNYA